MSLDEIRMAIRTYMEERYSIGEDDEFTDDVHIFDHGYVDSFGAVDLIQFVESKFAVKISDEDLVLRSLNTVNEIAQLVSERVTEES